MLDIEARVLIGWYSLASQSERVPMRCFYVKVAYLSYGEYNCVVLIRINRVRVYNAPKHSMLSLKFCSGYLKKSQALDLTFSVDLEHVPRIQHHSRKYLATTTCPCTCLQLVHVLDLTFNEGSAYVPRVQLTQ